jgi:AraC family transcriptional regulator, exoenzyme S synthesis regulatory protein ExsA
MAPPSFSGILYSCTEAAHRVGEQFVAEHALSFVVAGEMQFYTPQGTQVYGAGSVALVQRHQLVKTTKMPAAAGHFKAINIVLDQVALHRYAAAHQLAATAPYQGATLRPLSDDVFIQGFFSSLLPYFDQPATLSPALVELKVQEAIGLLLRHDPALRQWLFNFDEPGKIDLEAFMLQHYTFNVPLSQFARLTGRSLATFKRDFQRLFNTAPQRWLHQQRLNQAHFLIAQQQQAPAKAYLEVGFENLSHFSTAFKQHFGYTASHLAQQATRP